MEHIKSERLFGRARKFIPGGVNSPVRAWKSVGGSPVFIERGKGSHVFDVDGNEYIDYVMSYGPLILGHAHPKVVEAVKDAVTDGTTFGSCSHVEVEMAQAITKAIRSAKLVRMVNSGTEAVMSAIRLARGFTARDKIVKFDGSYHGHSDSLLVKAGSALAGEPGSSGVPRAVTQDTITLPYNDLGAVEEVVRGGDIACVIVEPVCGNMGVVPPKDGFLDGLRKLTYENDALLLFDEVITGFRLCYGGAQDYFGVEPDLTCLGKIIGGGFPVGAFCGRQDIMAHLAPDGNVYQAGTLSGNPVALSAGLATLDVLRSGKFYESLRKNSRLLGKGIAEQARDNHVDICVNGLESMLSLFFTKQEVYDYETANTSNGKRYATFFQSMLSSGLYLPPSRFESMFLSAVHTRKDVESTVSAAGKAFSEI